MNRNPQKKKPVNPELVTEEQNQPETEEATTEQLKETHSKTSSVIISSCTWALVFFTIFKTIKLAVTTFPLWKPIAISVGLSLVSAGKWLWLVALPAVKAGIVVSLPFVISSLAIISVIGIGCWLGYKLFQYFFLNPVKKFAEEQIRNLKEVGEKVDKKIEVVSEQFSQLVPLPERWKPELSNWIRWGVWLLIFLVILNILAKFLKVFTKPFQQAKKLFWWLVRFNQSLFLSGKKKSTQTKKAISNQVNQEKVKVVANKKPAQKGVANKTSKPTKKKKGQQSNRNTDEKKTELKPKN